MSSRRARAAALAAVLTAVIAGCGGEGTDAYTLVYVRSAEQFKQSVDAARAKAARAKTLADRVPALEAFKASTDRLARELARADPPGEVAELNDQAVDILHRFSDDLGELRQAAAANDKRGARALEPRLRSDQAELQDVLDQIDQKLGE